VTISGHHRFMGRGELNNSDVGHVPAMASYIINRNFNLTHSFSQ